MKGHAIHPKPKGRVVAVKGEILRVLQTRTGSLGAWKDQIHNNNVTKFYKKGEFIGGLATW